MSNKNVIFIGGPDSGKTNYLLRLWIAVFAEHCGNIRIENLPDKLGYVENGLHYINSGEFADRTSTNLTIEGGSISIPLCITNDGVEEKYNLFLPDVNGELWKTAVETTEITAEWMEQIENSDGAVIFVRPLSKHNCAPLDWVNSGLLIAHLGDNLDKNKIPTQVMLCEFIRLLETKINTSANAVKPRLSIIVTGWDALEEEFRNAGPIAYLNREFPLFSGKLKYLESFDVAIYASSVFGGDPTADNELKTKLMEYGFESNGYMVHDNLGELSESNNFFLPIAWALGTK